MQNAKFEANRTTKNLSSDRSIETRSISMRLTVSIIITVAIVSVVAITAIYLHEAQEAEKELELKADGSIAYLIGILEMPLWNLNRPSVKMIGKIVFQNELIAKLTIKDSSGSIIYSIEKEGRADLINKSGRIYHDGYVIGEVHISLTKQFYKESNRRLLFSFVLTILIILTTLVVVTGFLIRTFLRKPLNSLNEIVSSYASGVYDSPGHGIPYLEFQPIGNVLAQMGDKIIEQFKDIREAEEVTV